VQSIDAHENPGEKEWGFPVPSLYEERKNWPGGRKEAPLLSPDPLCQRKEEMERALTHGFRGGKRKSSFRDGEFLEKKGGASDSKLVDLGGGEEWEGGNLSLTITPTLRGNS